MPLDSIIAKVTTLLSTLWCNIPLIIVAVLGIGFLIIFHELGHLLFAKLFNVYAPSFSIGFGPRLFEVKIGETTYAVSAIPLGGYVELAGSHELGQGEQEHAQMKGDRSFESIAYWKKLLIMLGGIGFNIIFAYCALSFLFTQGAPCIGTWCNDKPALIGAVHKNTPAEKAGFKAGDTIISIGGTEITTIGSVTDTLKPFIDKSVTIKLMRDNQSIDTTITPTSQMVGSTKRPLLGVAWQIQKLDFVSSIKAGWQVTWELIVQTARALMNLTKSREGLGGPLMLICQVTQFAGMGMKMFLFMLAFISINLAVFNVIPLPIFDGGQVLFFTIEALLGRPLSDKARHRIHYYTWVFVILLVIYLTLKDILKLSTWF